MQLTGIALGGLVAILWGLADGIAALSARRLTTFEVTFISQFSGLLTLVIFALFFWKSSLALNLSFTGNVILMGVFTGACAAFGYFALYRALEIGPVFITSPLSSLSSVVTMVLSILLLQEHVSVFSGVAMFLLLLGILLSSINYRDLIAFFKRKPGKVLTSNGVRWAYGATIAFGLTDFGIGASTPTYGWFAPVFLTFTFSTFILACVAFYLNSPRGVMVNTSYGTQRGKIPLGSVLAVVAGILESMAILAFGMATQIIKPGETAAIASNYSLVAIIFGIFIFRERFRTHQLLGSGLVIVGVTVLVFLHP